MPNDYNIGRGGGVESKFVILLDWTDSSESSTSYKKYVVVGGD